MPGNRPDGTGEINMDDVNKEVKLLVTDPRLQQRLAKYIVEHCFRNSELENLHAGRVPDSKIGDYSEVFVTTPYGSIPQ